MLLPKTRRKDEMLEIVGAETRIIHTQDRERNEEEKDS